MQQSAQKDAEQTAAPAPLPGSAALALMQELAQWGNTTTIVLHGGSVFEFKGPFPEGSLAEGYFNLDGPVPGFHGHIRLEAIDHISFQSRQHRGRDSHAFCFQDSNGRNIFKVFLGRDENGALIDTQLERFQQIRDNGLPATNHGDH
jgi:putative heme utilization carrier protein HutX